MDEGTQNVHEVGGPTTRQSRRRMRVKAARVVGVLLILAIIGGAIGWLRFIQIVLVEGRAAYVDIRPGDSVTALSERVFALGMTSSPQALRWYWRLKRGGSLRDGRYALQGISNMEALYQLLSLIHISEPTRLGMISYAVFCLKKKKNKKSKKKSELMKKKKKNKNTKQTEKK